MSLILAIIPILIVLIGIVVLKKPAWIIALIGVVVTFILAVTAFSGEVSAMLSTTKAGVISALQVAFLVWGAFALLELMQVSTGMSRIKLTVSSLTKDRWVQIVSIAFCLGVFIEGATGNGVPTAILASFLLGLGFQPLVAACLICNGVPPCFGGAGVPTIAGMSAVTETLSLSGIVAITERFLVVGCLIGPTVLLVILYGRKSLKGMMGDLISVSLCRGIAMLFSKCSYLVLYIVADSITNSTFQLSAECAYKILISACAMGCAGRFLACEKNAILKSIKPISTLCVLYALANQMNSFGIISTIARFLADIAGRLHPAFSVLIGAIGAFITGSCLGSNKLFCMLHLEAATTLGVNPYVVVSASSAGGALGNMICPNNIIAVNATLELKNAEGHFFKDNRRISYNVSYILYTCYALCIYIILEFRNLRIVTI